MSSRLSFAFSIAAVLGAAMVSACAPPAAPQSSAVASDAASLAVTAAVHLPDYGGTSVPGDVRTVAEWALRTNDHGGHAFAEIDKKQARIYVFSGEGRLLGEAPVLLGSTIGDDTVPGVGAKSIAEIGTEERTTPAGRFVTTSGDDTLGHRMIWIDYDAGVAMHAVVTAVASEHRLERLESPDHARHRISYGCINLPTRFFADVTAPAFSSPGGTVYILPEVRRLKDVFPGLTASDKDGRRSSAAGH